MDIIGGYQDIRTNNEDLALTPFLFWVRSKNGKVDIYGLGISWFYYAIFLGIAFNYPKQIKRFLILNKKK